MKRCAIYTRVSTSMQAEKDYNSCEAQKDKILFYIKSQEDLELHKEYSDPAFSGSNIERPGLKELLKDVAAKKIQIVLTYKLDRLTRSSKDFYSLIDFFEKHGVAFVSISEHFDTSSASGRLLRNIMLTFGQFEREMTSERTRDKMLARADKGLWNGGYMPFGYKKEGNKLLVDKKKAQIVREIFEKFVLTGSLKQTLDFALKNEVRNSKTGKLFTINGVFHILRNPAYVGRMVWAKKVYQGIHEPIISKELFEHAQSLTKQKKIKRPLHREYILKGLLRCEECGSAMTPSFTNKKIKRYYYYKCISVVKHGCSACPLKAPNAEHLESFLIENLTRLAHDKQYIETLAFKIVHESPHPAGFELLKESSTKLATRVSEVLINFKNSIQTASAVERILIVRKTIQEIKLSKEYLQVTVSLKDTSLEFQEDFSVGGVARVARRAREGAVNPDAPACSTSSLLKNGDPTGIRTPVLTVKGWCPRPG